MALEIKDLTIDNIGIWPMPIKLLVILLVALGIMFAGYMLDIRSKQNDLQIVESQEIALKKLYEEKQQQAVNLEAYQEQMRTIEEYFGALLRQLPESTEVPGLVEDISHVGLASGLEIKAIKLMPESKLDFYTELPIEISVSGGFHNIGQFVSDVSALPRIVTLHDFSIKRAEGVNTGEVLDMNVIAKTYRYTAEDENS